MANQQVVLLRRPRGREVSADDFGFVETDRILPREGQVRVRVIYLSIDPAMRLLMNEDIPVVAPQPLNKVVRGHGLGIVEDSRHKSLPAGALVSGFLGWQRYATCDAERLTMLPDAPMLPMLAHLGLLGNTGLTAYFGLLELGAPKAGETLVVSAAAGSVGSLVGQIGKIKRCKVVGIAGGADKCRYLLDELGFDEAIDYKDHDVKVRLGLVARAGVDVYFDNVGGEIHDAVFDRMNECGRVIYCGSLSSGYGEAKTDVKLRSADITIKSLRLSGFKVGQFAHRADEAWACLVYWALSEKLKYRVHVLQGLENAPAALNMVFHGRNQGKMVVQVSHEPERGASLGYSTPS